MTNEEPEAIYAKTNEGDVYLVKDNKPMNTPDTEWVTQFEKLTERSIGEFDGVEATLWDVVYDYQTSQNSVAEEIVDFIRSTLTTRDTYWKERVRKEREIAKKWMTNSNERFYYEKELQALDNLK